jgi:hypothetical protein
MPTTTNQNWTTPADSDLVRNGAQAIRVLANGIDTTVGKWNTYTPSIGTDGGTTNWTLGSGAIVGRYQRIADTVHFELKFAIASGTKGNGGITFTLPVAADIDVEPNFCVGTFYDASATDFYPVIARISGTTLKPFIVATTMNQITATVPVTVATNDYISINGTYKV